MSSSQWTLAPLHVNFLQRQGVLHAHFSAAISIRASTDAWQACVEEVEPRHGKPWSPNPCLAERRLAISRTRHEQEVQFCFVNCNVLLQEVALLEQINRLSHIRIYIKLTSLEEVVVSSLRMLSTCVLWYACHTLDSSFDDDDGDGDGDNDGKLALQIFQMNCKKFNNLKKWCKITWLQCFQKWS